jgi:ATP phosphoribosyltransferase
VLDDGVILKSQANLMASRASAWTPELAVIEAQICERLRKASAR